jgi:hypothetical protein
MENKAAYVLCHKSSVNVLFVLIYKRCFPVFGHMKMEIFKMLTFSYESVA